MSGHVLALSGGVGGAKLAAGLADVLAPGRLTIAVNTGDDFEHLGLTICPDIDPVLYTMAGLNDRQRGWGMANESWHMMEQLRALGEEDWFNLGDRDLATHIARTLRLRAGGTLSEVTAHLARSLGIVQQIVPMSDDPVRTQVLTGNGWTDFQRWFVGEQCGPAVSDIRFTGTPGAAISPGLSQALAREDLAAIVLCPSNPFLKRRSCPCSGWRARSHTGAQGPMRGDIPLDWRARAQRSLVKTVVRTRPSAGQSGHSGALWRAGRPHRHRSR